jgi:hypothetical protein
MQMPIIMQMPIGVACHSLKRLWIPWTGNAPYRGGAVVGQLHFDTILLETRGSKGTARMCSHHDYPHDAATQPETMPIGSIPVGNT